VADRFDGVAGALEALEQAELDGVFLRLAAGGREQLLEFAALGDIAGSLALIERQASPLAHLLALGGVFAWLKASDRISREIKEGIKRLGRTPIG
jgi:hypothetical protein